MKVEEKREPRSYKAKETPYAKASKRAKKEGTTLAELVETWVVCYAIGIDVCAVQSVESSNYKSDYEKFSKKRTS